MLLFSLDFSPSMTFWIFGSQSVDFLDPLISSHRFPPPFFCWERDFYGLSKGNNSLKFLHNQNLNRGMLQLIQHAKRDIGVHNAQEALQMRVMCPMHVPRHPGAHVGGEARTRAVCLPMHPLACALMHAVAWATPSALRFRRMQP